MAYACLLHASTMIFELGTSGLQPVKLYAPPAVKKNAYAHIIMTLRGTYSQQKKNLRSVVPEDMTPNIPI